MNTKDLSPMLEKLLTFDNQALDLTQSISWTPQLAFGGSSTGITYTLQAGDYRAVGPIVFVRGTISLSSVGSATGSASIGPLPVTPYSSLVVGYFGVGGSFATLNVSPYGLIAGSENTISLVKNVIVPSPQDLVNTDFSNSSTLVFTGFYFWY